MYTHTASTLCTCTVADVYEVSKSASYIRIAKNVFVVAQYMFNL